MKSICIETYGCSANQAHSEKMEGVLAKNGFKITKEIENADTIVINTCIAKTPTENKIRDRIKFILRKHPGKRIVITGCAADINMFRDIAPEAIFLSSHKSEEIAKVIQNKADLDGKKIRKNPLVGITEISSGCMGKCAYCAVKLARGELKSRTIKEILSDVEDSLKDGCREIWMTSQDNSCYGLDMETNLAELLENITHIKGDFRVRVGMMNPSHIGPIFNKLAEIYKNPKIYKFIHIPVQSGSDRVLELMKRGYSVKGFEKIIEKFRESIPFITVSTDIIVGFPGETEEDFERTLELVGRVRPDIVNVSRFGPRPGTEAARMNSVDMLENKVAKRRSKRLSCLARKIGLEKNNEWIGRHCDILVTEMGKKEKQFMGRNESYKPVVIEGNGDAIGKMLKVRISMAGQTYLGA